MARAKTTQTTSDETKELEVVNVEQAVSEEKEKEQENTKDPAENEEKSAKEIPDYADKILKLYPNYKKLWIDAHGGIYTSECKNVSKDKAVLYENPYFKQ